LESVTFNPTFLFPRIRLDILCCPFLVFIFSARANSNAEHIPKKVGLGGSLWYLAHLLPLPPSQCLFYQPPDAAHLPVASANNIAVCESPGSAIPNISYLQILGT